MVTKRVYNKFILYITYQFQLLIQIQGYNARKVISFVLQCTAVYCSVLSLGGNVNTRQIDVEALHGIHLSHIKSMKYSGHRKLLCELLKLSKFNAFNLQTNTDGSILVYKFRPERTGFNMYAEYTARNCN